MSTIWRVGLAGVSTHTSDVSGRTASATSSALTQVTSWPSRPLASRWSVPPYRGRTATMCPCRDNSRAVVAAMPDAKATAASAFSSTARPVSKPATVGLCSRE